MTAKLLADSKLSLKFDEARIERDERGNLRVALFRGSHRLVNLGPFYLNPYDVITLPLRGEMDFELSTA